MTEFAQHTSTKETATMFPAHFVAAQERNTALITRANEVMVNTARAVWESEMELLRLGSEQLAHSVVPLKSEDPAAAVSACCEHWKEGSEKLLDHIRSVSDLIRKCSWDLLRIYQEGLRDAGKPVPLRPR